MYELVHHVALVLALLALGVAALRIASCAAPSGLERLIATAVTAVGIAVAEALALGLVNLGGDTIALVAAAGATWAAALRFLPAPQVAPIAELRGWWERLGGPARVAAAALGGLSAAWLAWQLRNFSIGFDSALYHYPLVAGWIANGSPGSELALSYEIPYGSYPVTDEVALTWAAAISRSWVPLALWNPLLLGLLAVASWLTLRNLLVSRAVTVLATAALVTTPILVRQLNEPQTDLPALAWLACVAALSTSAARRPALLVPAVLAAGLAIGTKPSTAPMAIGVLGVGAVLARGRLRPLAGWLAAAVAAAFVVGGIWYARNTIEHGSPLWPFAPGPFGDPEPRLLSLVNQTFIQRPGATLDGRLDEYVERLGGTWLILLGSFLALGAGLLGLRSDRRLRRAVLVSSGLAVAGLLIWSGAWGTGLPTSADLRFADGFPISALRFMLAAIAAATVAVAVLSRARGPLGTLAIAILSVALGWNLLNDVRLGSPWTPPAPTLAIGVVAGVALLGIGLVAWPRPSERTARSGRVPQAAAVAIAALGVGGLLGLTADGFVERYTKVANTSAYGPELVSWFAGQPEFEHGDGPIAIASYGVIAQLAGDRFEHEIVLVPQRASCKEVERLARRMPMVVTEPAFFRGLLGLERYTAPACLKRRRPTLDRDPFFVYRLEPAAAGGR